MSTLSDLRQRRSKLPQLTPDVETLVDALFGELERLFQLDPDGDHFVRVVARTHGFSVGAWGMMGSIPSLDEALDIAREMMRVFLKSEPEGNPT